MLFKTTLDGRVKFITTAIIILSLFVSFIIIFSGVSVSVKAIVIFFLWSLIIFSFLLSPHGYLLDEENLTILTKIKKFRIPISSIKALRKMEKNELFGMIRVLGIGGLFGFIGIFYSRNLGFIFSFVTNYNNLIFIKSSMTFLISPEERDLFLSMMENVK